MYNGVQAFRLISGEDVFGSVTKFDEDKFQDEPFIQLNNAAVISMRMDEKTKHLWLALHLLVHLVQVKM